MLGLDYYKIMSIISSSNNYKIFQSQSLLLFLGKLFSIGKYLKLLFENFFGLLKI